MIQNFKFKSTLKTLELTLNAKTRRHEVIQHIDYICFINSNSLRLCAFALKLTFRCRHKFKS